MSEIDPKALARRSDPITSLQSAIEHVASGKAVTECVAVFAALVAYGADCTSRELANHSGIDKETCHRRLPDLRDKFNAVWNPGKTICSVTRKRALLWRARKPEERTMHAVAEPPADAAAQGELF